MRLAILFFGISNATYLHMGCKMHVVDYKLSYDNYKKYLFDYFKEKGYDIDVYFTTNIMNKKDEEDLIQTYNPVQYSFIENNTNNTISRNKKLDKVIDLCLKNNKEYDLVLITRFDLLFMKNFHESNIKFDKFNLVSILEKPDYICDNFYLLPYQYLSCFSKVVKKNLIHSFHFIKKDIDNINGIDFIHYILNENDYVYNLNFYKIVRTII